MRTLFVTVLISASFASVPAMALPSDQGTFRLAIDDFQSGDFVNAAKLLLELSQRYPRVRADAAQALSHAGNMDEAYRVASEAAAGSDYPHAHIVLAEIDRRLGLLDQAEHETATVISLSPPGSESSGEGHMTLGLIKYLRGDLIGSSEENSLALAYPLSAENVAISWFNASCNSVLLGRFAEAREFLRRSLEVNPDLTIAYLGQAAVEDLSGHGELAAKLAKTSESFSRWERDSQGQVYVWPEIEFHWKGLRAEAAGRTQEAISAWNGLQRIECAGKLHTPIYSGRAQAHLQRLGRIGGCGASVASVAALAPAVEVSDLVFSPAPVDSVEPTARGPMDTAGMHIRMAIAASDDRQWKVAQQEYEQAIAIELGNLVALRGLGKIALVRGDMAVARRSFETALELSVHPLAVSDALTDLAYVDATEGKFDDAEQKLNLALDSTPDNPRPYLGLASLYRNTGREDSAPLMERQAQLLNE